MLIGSEWIWITGAVAFVVLIELLSRTRAWPRVVKLLGGPDPDYPKPPLEADEAIIRESRVEFTRSLHGGRVGRLLLTNRRVIWYEDAAYTVWPFKRISGQLRLNEIVSVDKSSPLEHIFGGRRLRLSLRQGKNKRLWVDGLDEWIKAIRIAMAGTRQQVA